MLGDNRLSLFLQMTSGEMKFALVVESVLNSVPEPEYRQMLVEALCVVSMIVENQVRKKHLLFELARYHQILLGKTYGSNKKIDQYLHFN